MKTVAESDGCFASFVWEFTGTKISCLVCCFLTVCHFDLCVSLALSGEAWQLEDDCNDPVGDPALQPRLCTMMDEAPFRSFRSRSFYMRKSLSVDNHLSSLNYSIHPAETKTERVKTKLRRQFVSTEKCCLTVGNLRYLSFVASSTESEFKVSTAANFSTI